MLSPLPRKNAWRIEGVRASDYVQYHNMHNPLADSLSKAGMRRGAVYRIDGIGEYGPERESQRSSCVRSHMLEKPSDRKQNQ
jgi:hypothetical protein